MFRDKLSPRWQFGVWGLLALVLLLPAGWGGRYALVNWPWLVETLKTLLAGDYGLTAVTAPVPLPPAGPPETAADWLFLIYAAGVLALLGRYGASYLRLRRALRRGNPAGPEAAARIRETAEHTACRPAPSWRWRASLRLRVRGVPAGAGPARRGGDGRQGAAP